MSLEKNKNIFVGLNLIVLSMSLWGLLPVFVSDQGFYYATVLLLLIIIIWTLKDGLKSKKITESLQMRTLISSALLRLLILILFSLYGFSLWSWIV